MTISVSPVNSSAPPIITRIRPSENTSPANSRATPHGNASAPLRTTVENNPPKAINAPASTPRTSKANASRLALATPTFSQACAISGGSSALIKSCWSGGVFGSPIIFPVSFFFSWKSMEGRSRAGQYQALSGMEFHWIFRVI